MVGGICNVPQQPPKMLYHSCSLILLFFVAELRGHGMMLDPPNRSSLWRFDPTAPVNYNDNENFCGGWGTQWGSYGGKCGVCGDSYGNPIPRPNENTGKYGQGKVVAKYPSGSVIDVMIKLTANHKGWFNYSLCALNDPSKPETDDCFQPLRFEDGSQESVVPADVKHFYQRVQLPKGLKCDRCVLRWTYRAGNIWGTCEDGSGAAGCGPQEHFRSCSDIAII